jgi:hypothetical protein
MKSEEPPVVRGPLRTTESIQIVEHLSRASSRASSALEFLPFSLQASPLARRHLLRAVERAFLDAAFQVAAVLEAMDS